MIVPASHLEEVFQAMKADCNRSDDQSVLVFVSSTDVDSVCAAQQFLCLLHKEDIHFTLIPVQCYEEVRDGCSCLKGAQELKTVFLINCGATEDVRSLCELQEHDSIRFIILDNHRPVWHGHNRDEDTNVLVLVDDDDPVPKADVPPVDEELDQPGDSDDESDDADMEEEDADEGEGEDDDAEGATTAKRRRTGGDASTSQPGGAPPVDREAAQRERRAQRRERAALIDTYYSQKNGYGKPSSVVLFSLCHQLQHQDDFFLVWCAIVGLTEQIIFQQISKQQYNTWRQELANHVAKLEEVDDVAVKDGVLIPNHKVIIQRCNDFRLTLLRQWSIEESLRYTGYVAARLQTWRQKGLENVWALLLVMCIPLRHATIPFKGVRDVYAQQLERQLPIHGPKHMLAWDSLQLDSFRVLYKHEEVSASDMVFALMGLITAPGQTHTEAFNTAANAMHLQGHLHLVDQGIEAAKRLCMDIVHECGLLVTTGKVVGGSRAAYRYVNMNEYNTNAGRGRFSHPTVLKYMAYFLRDAVNQRFSSSDARRPVVVAGLPDENGFCCVVAVHAKHISGNTLQNNPFARPFIETLAALDLQTGQGSFDNSIYYLHKDCVGQFLAKLKDVVEDYQQSNGTNGGGRSRGVAGL